MNIPLYFRWLAALALLSVARPVSAQWVTQSVELKAGWNAVFLHVDASYGTIDTLVDDDINNPIIELWKWNPPATTQFTESPQNPNLGSEWTSWVRTRSINSLQRIQGDTAYLVRVGTNVNTYTWSIKGRPVPPHQQWTVTGLNLVGFPTVPSTPPNFEAFLLPSPELQTVTPEIYYYPGGELSVDNPLKPAPSLFRALPVNRGQAYWVRAGEVFNEYFGPFEVLVGRTGLQFHDNVSANSLRLRNLSREAVTVNVSLTGGELPPAGQRQISGVPPPLIRGSLNPENLTYGYTNLPTGTLRSWSLAPRGEPGSEIEVVFGLNRSAITVPPGSFLAGVLQFTDSLGHTRVDVPVSATASSTAGLWVGGASVSQVGHYLKSYQRGTVTDTIQNEEGEYVETTTENALLTGPDGRYVVSSVDTSLGDVPRAFPLRLIVHNPEVGNAVLLQRVFHGMGSGTNLIVTRDESMLAPEFLKEARRVSAVNLPWTPDNTAWDFDGRLQTETTLTTTVTLGYNDRAANPFVHAYHPDHDNLDATFENVLPQGSESYGVQRTITLAVEPPADNFTSLISSGLTLSGVYSETITVRGLARAGGTFDTREFETRGVFQLNRISDIPSLTSAP